MTKKHVIPLGTLVEVCGDSCLPNGIRLFVGRHDIDCDGTPLYDLVFDKDYIGQSLSEHNKDITDEYLIGVFSAMYNAKFDCGYTTDCLKIIKLPE